jgi:DNA-directed RNA polymerase specialized sigma24 family protein
MNIITLKVGDKDMSENSKDLKSWTRYIQYLLWKRFVGVPRTTHDDIVQEVLLEIYDKDYVTASFVKMMTFKHVDRYYRNPRNVATIECPEYLEDLRQEARDTAKLELDSIMDQLSADENLILIAIMSNETLRDAAKSLDISEDAMSYRRDKLYCKIREMR